MSYGGEVLRKKKKRKKRVDKLIVSLSFVFITTLGGFCLLKSNLFNVNEIEINGNKNLKNSDIINEDDLIDNKNIFTYSLKSINNDIESNPYIKSADVSIKLPNKIVINVEEVNIVGLLSNSNEHCYIDKDGNLVEKINDLSENNDKIIIKTNFSIDNGEDIKFKNENDKTNILNILSLIEENSLGLKVRKIEYNGDSDINLITKYGTTFIMENNDIKYNISRVSKILVDLQSKNIKSGIVDLTYSNYALYRPS